MQLPKGKEQANKAMIKSQYFDDMKNKLAEIKYQIKGVDVKNLEQVLVSARFEKKNSVRPDYNKHSLSVDQRMTGSAVITERTAKPSQRST